MGEGIPTEVWYTEGRAPNNPNNEPFLTWLINVVNASNPPLLFSISYGEDEKSVGYNFSNRVNVEFCKAGVMGISLLFASGDSGAGGNCTRSGGRETPDFPSGSPYVTVVGGVHGGTVGKSPTGEVAWVDSGGGFSDYWTQPSWQTSAVTNYISTASNLPNNSIWNQRGRGYPDIAAQSVDFAVIRDGHKIAVSGTSCASPTAGGVFALLNDLRLQNNMSPLGFLNPFIYETAADDSTTFNDIISGHNVGCGTSEIGFPTNIGWDAVTGFGSPDYAKLAKHVLKTGCKTMRNGSRRKRNSKNVILQIVL